MNLVGIEGYTQKVVLGMVILSAVSLDMFRVRRSQLSIIALRKSIEAVSGPRPDASVAYRPSNGCKTAVG